MAWPTPKVTAGRHRRHRQLAQRRDDGASRSVKRASTTPTTSDATAPSTIDSTMAAVPEVKSHGSQRDEGTEGEGDEGGGGGLPGRPQALRA